MSPVPGAAFRADEAIEFVDLAPRLRAIDPAYLDAPGCPRDEIRVHVLAWCGADARLYVVVANAFVFWSDDGGQRWHEIREINRAADGALHAYGVQHVDAIVDTPAGTVLMIGRDRHDGVDRGVTWRRPAGATSFARTAVVEPAWAAAKGGNATAGYIGSPPRPMVAFAVYATPAHLWTSVDDGLRWQRQDLEAAFKLHVHEVYLPRAANLHRTARLWVTGGDDPSGQRSGVVTFDRVHDDGTLGGFDYALRERSGYRLVGLAGDGKHVYIGNESIAGGMLRVLDNAQSIALRDFEYVLGKHRHDYHQFRSMAVTPDGFLAAATDSYAFTGDTIRADSGGYLYLSSDGGASFRELSLGMKWITALVADGRSFWIAGGMNREDGGDPSALALTLLRVPKPGPGAVLASPYCAKVVVADSSVFYEKAGYADHPRPVLAPGERTFRADLSPYASIVVDVEASGPARLAVEALPFQTWHPDEDAWRDVAVLATATGRLTVALPPAATHHRWYRVRNAADAPLEVRRIAFLARRSA